MKIFIDSINNILDIFNVKLEETGSDWGLFIHKEDEKSKVYMALYEVRGDEGYGIMLSSNYIGSEFDELADRKVKRCPDLDGIFGFLNENKNIGSGGQK
jgi:hypothetical protein